MSEECSDCHILKERVFQIEKRIYERFSAEEKVRDETKAALTARLDGMNEFRAQINTERLGYARAEIVNELRDQIAQITSGVYVTWWTLLGALGAFGMLVIALTTLIVGLITGKL